MQRVKLEMCYLLNVCLYINDYKVFKNFIQVNKKTQMALKCRKINICPIMDFTKEFKLMYENIETLRIGSFDAVKQLINTNVIDKNIIIDLTGMNIYEYTYIYNNHLRELGMLKRFFKTKVRELGNKMVIHTKNGGTVDTTLDFNEYKFYIDLTNDSISIIYSSADDYQLILDKQLFSLFDR